jgi:hypothetical protein
MNIPSNWLSVKFKMEFLFLQTQSKNQTENNLHHLIETALAQGDGSFLLMDKNENQEVFSTKGNLF